MHVIDTDSTARPSWTISVSYQQGVGERHENGRERHRDHKALGQSEEPYRQVK